MSKIYEFFRKNRLQGVENKRMSISPQQIHNDNFSEFINNNRNKKYDNEPNKFFRQNEKFKQNRDVVDERFDVSDITQIVFEEHDGNEILFTDLFEYRASIGSGGFGYVVAVLEKETGAEIAVKIVNRYKRPK